MSTYDIGYISRSTDKNINLGDRQANKLQCEKGSSPPPREVLNNQAHFKILIIFFRSF
jgi:hypothetical protein